ncbi:MAG: hypothetical protein QHJ73_17540, partial [Armatimonadota bacterium]|nr:hypothetical protein [Armatimonadota bacterium]
MRDETLTFSQGSLLLRTPWGAAPGSIWVNDEPVRAAWEEDGAGRPFCVHGAWRLTVVRTAGGGVMLEVRNAGAEPRRLSVVCFGRWNPSAFSPPLNTWEFRELVQGTSFSSIYAGVKGVGRKAPAMDFVAPSSMLTVYQREEGGALLLGVLPPVGPAFSEFVTLHSHPHLEGTFGVEVRHRFECEVPSGEAVCTAPLLALAGGKGIELLEEFGNRWQGLVERKPTRPPMVGWNSWDYYSGAVTREAMDENLTASRELFGDALRVFVIDEGWERQWGSWEPNGKFPAGL